MKPKSTKQIVFEYLQTVGSGGQFHGYLIHGLNHRFPMSGLQRLRELRADKKIEYRVIDRTKSLYELLWIVDKY